MRLRALFPAMALLAASAVAAPPAALAAASPYERGPAPTTASVEAARGPFATATATVSSVSGFGGGTVYYPTSTAEGTFGAVAISPGFTATQSSVAWLGPRLASQGFVVITINTLSTLDQPDSRGAQLLAALDYLTTSSSVRTRIDASRLGVMGHSMGGGGSLRATVSRPSLQAAIPLAPWHTTKNWSSTRVPTMIIGAESDSTAPVSSHSEPFYTSMTSAPDKAYLELNNAGHSAPTSANTTVAKYSISWLKRFIDNDTRYDQFLCPAPSPSSLIEEYRATCPHS
ncbi:Triacylglycerol lipase [Actinosynnema mirum DSM 43827]|uniref:Triacylglycerol lipase n=2 Tax=Actinosynnema TaxID=40566 RepID=C6WFI2_ACTMD|nr:Triacylglycerol lipase [Actinosynnema mirum DSM 43827]AXX29339.1 Triacylglycerol lipase precursor [Actinosynnema pretiosum subsp. pretiosum]